ncbi:MAG: CAP domain-containing protein [Candidatus Levybacteria bacterium]|nr:CAP domain-containing protein [Candidatus Levybacteria bacterium]
MKEFLSHLFMPRESNNHRAKILHHTNLFLTIVFLLLASFLIQGAKGAFPSVLGIKVDISSDELLFLTNKERQNAGVGSLILNDKLSEAALKKAQDMFEYDYWAHNSPTGKSPWTFIKSSGYKYVYAGENLARGFSTADAAIKAWMASPDHRNNMLSGNYQDVGFAIAIGKINGEETVLIVEELGNLHMPIARSKVEAIAAAEDIDAVPKNVQAIHKQPLINTSSLSSNIYYVFIVVFIMALFLDMIIVEKNKIMRFVGHNIDHILYLFLILILAGIWSKGVII